MADVKNADNMHVTECITAIFEVNITKDILILSIQMKLLQFTSVSWAGNSLEQKDRLLA